MKKKLFLKMPALVILIVTSICCEAQWIEVEQLTTARAQSTASLIDKKIYLMGGLAAPYSTTASSEVNVFDVKTDTWLPNAPDLPVPLCAASSCVVDGRIYIIGGHNSFSGSGALASVYEFNPEEEGTWISKANMLKPRFYHTSTVVDGKIYVIGGRSEDYPAPIENTVEMYDPETDTWIFVESMPSVRALHTAETVEGKIYVLGSLDTALTTVNVFDPMLDTWTVSTPMPRGRVWHGSGVIGGKIYVFGGAPTSETWVFDPVEETWSVLPGATFPESIGWYGYAVREDASGYQCLYSFGGAYFSFYAYPNLPPPFVSASVYKYCLPQLTSWISQEAVLPTARAQTTASLLDNKIYLIGGLDAPDSWASPEVNVYDPTVDSWLANAPNLPVPLCAASSSVINGKIYVTGGHTSYSSTGARASVYEYDPAAGAFWTSKTNMNKPRFYHRSVVVDGKIYVMGGRSLDPPADLEKSMEMYDPVTGTWTEVASMQTSRALHTAAVVNGKIYVMGNADTTDTTVEVYDPPLDTWTETTAMPRGRVWHGSEVIGDKIYVFGGGPGSETLEFDPLTETWSEVVEADFPGDIGWFGYAVAEDASGDQCLYSLGGAYPSFFFGGPSPYVTDLLYKYCPTINSIPDPEKASKTVVEIQNYPNPFRNNTSIKYVLKNSGQVTLNIVNINGQQIATLFDGFQSSGEQEIEWNAEGLPNGVYLYRLQINSSTIIGKCILQK